MVRRVRTAYRRWYRADVGMLGAALLLGGGCGQQAAGPKPAPRATVVVAPVAATVAASASTAAVVAPKKRWPAVELANNGKLVWHPYSAALIAEANEQRRPLFVRLDAVWAAHGQATLRVVLEDPEVQRAFIETQVLPVHADFTAEDPTVAALLASMGRVSVPQYMVIRPDGKRVVLESVLGSEHVIAALRDAVAPFSKPRR